MDSKLDKKLCDRFPVLYQDRRSPMSQTCMCWGFDCADGWFDIIWQLSLAIEEELGYTRWQSFWFLFKKHFAMRWNRLIYRLSPVRQQKYRTEGDGSHEHPYKQVLDHQDPPRWDERIAQFLFGKTVKYGKWETERMALKNLVFWPDTGFAVVQVKEKYGELRFYTNRSNENIDRCISLAERLSRITCEECGKPGKLGQSGGWYSTRCKEHASPNWQDAKEE